MPFFLRLFPFLRAAVTLAERRIRLSLDGESTSGGRPLFPTIRGNETDAFRSEIRETRNVGSEPGPTPR